MAPLSPSSPRVDSGDLVPGDDLLNALSVQHKRSANGDGLATAAAATGAGEEASMVAATTMAKDAVAADSSSSTSAAYAAGERAALALCDPCVSLPRHAAGLIRGFRDERIERARRLDFSKVRVGQFN